MRQFEQNKKVADAKAKSRSLINASLLWYFDMSKINDLQSQIQLQNNENERLRLKKKLIHK